MELLRDVPAASLSLREVARKAGVSHGAPYHHFSDRNELLASLGTECRRQFVEVQQVAISGQDAPAERLLAMGGAYLRFALDRPNEFALIFDPVFNSEASPREEDRAYIEGVKGHLVRLTGEAQSVGRLPPGPVEPLADALWGVVHGLSGLAAQGHVSSEDAMNALRAVVRKR